MPAQSHLLVDVLDWHEAHVALPRCGRDRLGVVAVILAARALAVRRDELGGNDPRLQAVIQAATRPMVRPAARLHRHHRAGRQLGQPQGKRLAPQILPLQYMADAIDLAHRKQALRQIHANGYSAHGDFLFC